MCIRDSFRDFLLVATCHTAGDLHDGIIVDAALCVNLFQNLDDEVSVIVIDSVDEGLALAIRVEVPCDFFKNRPVEEMCIRDRWCTGDSRCA